MSTFAKRVDPLWELHPKENSTLISALFPAIKIRSGSGQDMEDEINHIKNLSTTNGRKYIPP